MKKILDKKIQLYWDLENKLHKNQMIMEVFLILSLPL
jgi:hypothetical protein